MEETGDVISYLSGYFSEKLIIGLIIARLVSTFIEKIIHPMIDIYLFDIRSFKPLNIYVDKDTKNIVCEDPDENPPKSIESIDFGYLLREILIFSLLYAIIYFFIIKQ